MKYWSSNNLQASPRTQVGKLNTDVLLETVPVCAPYNAMAGYKYRVKILPGTLKKGKAARQAMTFFETMKEATNVVSDNSRSRRH
jgi:hypothetical protein